MDIQADRLIVTNPGAVMGSMTISAPDKAKLRLFTNTEGKLDAEYDPADLTETALLFIEEMRRVQGIPGTTPL